MRWTVERRMHRPRPPVGWSVGMTFPLFITKIFFKPCIADILKFTGTGVVGGKGYPTPENFLVSSVQIAGVVLKEIGAQTPSPPSRGLAAEF